MSTQPSLATSPAPSHLTWPHALDTFESHLLARRASPRTIRDYLRAIRLLKEHLKTRSPDQVTLPQLRDYQCGLLTGACSRSGRPASAAFVARVSTTIRRFFAFLTQEGLLQVDPALQLERPKVPRYRPGQVLPLEAVERLLSPLEDPTPRDVRDQTLVEVFFASGLRLAEVLALDLGDVRRAERELVVRHGKGDKARVVPLTRSAFLRLEDYLRLARPALQTRHADSAQALFLSQRGRRLSARALADGLVRLGERVGLEERVRPHDLRRTFATTLLKAGVSVRHIQVLLGHSNLSTTASYLRLDAQELRKEILLKHPRERFEV